MEITELIKYILPILSLVIAISVFFMIYMQRLSKKFEDYKNDQFRQSIEKQIYELTKELTVNKDRFNSINHLLIDAQNIQQKIGNIENTKFFNKVGIQDIAVDPKLVFVLTPFNDQYDNQYQTIKNTVESLGFTCNRGDEDNLPSNILPYIIKQIKKSRLVIANISGRNPNVFYELGIAHSLGKPVVIVSEAFEDIPFDVGSTRILTFKDLKHLSEQLRKWLVHALAGSAQPDNQPDW